MELSSQIGPFVSGAQSESRQQAAVLSCVTDVKDAFNATPSHRPAANVAARKLCAAAARAHATHESPPAPSKRADRL